MSTDMTMEEMVERLRFENAPAAKPEPRVKRPSGVFGRLRAKRSKLKNFSRAIDFAAELLGYQMTGKPLQRSIKLQQGISTRAARAAIRAAKPKKHRRRR